MLALRFSSIVLLVYVEFFLAASCRKIRPKEMKMFLNCQRIAGIHKVPS